MNKNKKELAKFTHEEILAEFEKRAKDGEIELVWVVRKDDITTFGGWEKIQTKDKKYQVKVHELTWSKEVKYV